MAPSDPDRYALGDEIARGGMGAIVRAHDRTLNREVAVKILLDKYAPDSGAARRFADEAKITGQLQHPGIPPVYDLGALPDGRPFLAMKLIKGDNLDDRLKQRSDPTADRGELVAAFESICQAVGYAHAHGVVHRDLKPQNVMVGAFGEVQVMDWGLAKVLGTGRPVPADDPEATTPTTAVVSDRDSEDLLTKAGSVLGTPAYMPPEQAIGAVDQIDQRSDVFGLGGILAAILTGRPPFVGDTAESTRQMAAQGKLSDCFARLDGCGADPELLALCKRCLATDKADRPTEAGAVATAVHDLRAAADERARQAELERVKAEATAVEQRKRRRVQAALAVAAVLLVAGAGSVAVWRVDEDGKKRAEAVQRASEEREQKVRAADAAAGLLDQAEAVLAAGDADRAAPFLDQAAARVAESGGAAAARLAHYQDGLAVLRELDAVDNFRWTTDGLRLRPSEQVVEKWAVVFGKLGIVPGTFPTAEAIARVRSSPVRVSLVAALDGWLASGGRGQSESVWVILRLVDPDPFRSGVRWVLADRGDPKERTTLAELVSAEPGAGQLALIHPGRYMTLELGRSNYPKMVLITRANAARLAGVAARAWVNERDSVRLDGVGARAWVNERDLVWLDVRPEWSAQPAGLAGAYAAAPCVPSDAGQAVLARVAAVRPDDFGLLMSLANTSHSTYLTPNAMHDRAGWYRAAAALRPRNPAARSGLGSVLYERGELEAAAVSFREAIRLDPRNSYTHNGLGRVLYDQGNLDGAAAEYREAIHLDPKLALAHISLGDVRRRQGRHTEAVVAYQAALAINPFPGPAQDGLDYCLRVQRGEVPTAPPPRAVGR